VFKIFSTYICCINKKMRHLYVSGEVRPLKWPLGVKWLILHRIIASNRIYDQRDDGLEKRPKQVFAPKIRYVNKAP
jgi:hypothetical protein